ncbi:hypothetical protein SipoB123_31490 [Streptomyces ipomoeae]|nr:hypothetical protein SipoB123_31490 [Streptomyces ipomoeae]
MTCWANEDQVIAMARDVLKTADLHGRKYSIDAVLAAAGAREATPTICISSSQVTPCESRRSDETAARTSLRRLAAPPTTRWPYTNGPLRYG